MTPPRPRGTTDAVDLVVVVVPVHDEEELLPRCLASLRRAVDHAVPDRVRATDDAGPRDDIGVAYQVVVALDACRDRSAAIASASGFDTAVVERRSVGAARAAGYRHALEAAAVPSRQDPHRVWLAATDADSVVPPHWLTTQLDLARGGADVMIGTVRPDPADLTPAQREAWHARHVPGQANGHVHGANLGVRADLYLAAGGFQPLPEHEDVELVARLRRAGARTVATDACWVRTSGRSHGRTPGGYARYLREDLMARSG
ncbi:glycosyltransferase [Luteimicrobium subarcticum]|uniref:4,4'-diaponeurosporenoate glycosyltransferase n=1 Tax=Luteimicrobium subarcticum TaxID=620910 RepID=A0A2M8WRF5_9MICO|nr:glycosyltransferase [Luteimicrobium subarcticum]PJI93521.1 glycosyl transferase family 2 [Luteimicrobium subarcticum]